MADKNNITNETINVYGEMNMSKTKVHIAKQAKKEFNDAKSTFNESVVAVNTSNGSIAIYKSDKMEIAKEKIISAKKTQEIAGDMLDDNSHKRAEHEQRYIELVNLYEKTKKL